MKNTKKKAPTTQKLTTSKPNHFQFGGKRNYFEPKKRYSKSFHTASFGSFPHCTGDHVMMQCPKFIDTDAEQRNNLVAKLHVCRNCLYSHGNANWNSTKTCKESKKWVSYQRWRNTSPTNPGETDEIEKQILTLKSKEVLPSTVTTYDTHLYAITYTLLGAVIVAAVVWTLKHRAALLNAVGEERNTKMYPFTKTSSYRADTSGQRECRRPSSDARTLPWPTTT